MHYKSNMNRRSALTLLSGTLLAASAGRGWGQSVGGDLIVANWGGSYGGFAEESFEKPIVQAAGVNVIHDYQSAPERITKVLAESRLPRGRIGVAHTADFITAQLGAQGVLADITTDEVPNIVNAIEKFKSPFFVPWIYSPLVILYNPKFVSSPPTSFAEFWDSKYAGKIGLMDHISHHHIQMAGIVASGSPIAEQEGKPLLLEFKQQVQPRIYPGQDQLVAGFQNEEIWIATGYKARALFWAEAGAPIEYVYPSDGGIANILGASATKNAPNQEAAFFYLNSMIDSDAMARMVEISKWSPCVSGVPLDPSVQESVDLTDEELEKLHVPDPLFMSENYNSWIQWWNRDFKAS